MLVREDTASGLVQCLGQLEGEDLIAPSALLSKLVLGAPICAQQLVQAGGLSPAHMARYEYTLLDDAMASRLNGPGAQGCCQLLGVLMLIFPGSPQNFLAETQESGLPSPQVLHMCKVNALSTDQLTAPTICS